MHFISNLSAGNGLNGVAYIIKKATRERSY